MLNTIVHNHIQSNCKHSLSFRFILMLIIKTARNRTEKGHQKASAANYFIVLGIEIILISKLREKDPFRNEKKKTLYKFT